MKLSREQKQILKILDNHSGGCKMTELITEYISAEFDYHGCVVSKNFVEILPKEIQKMRKIIGVLEYAYPLGGKRIRVKEFVYRKLK